jgi:hypothetical protein
MTKDDVICMVAGLRADRDRLALENAALKAVVAALSTAPNNERVEICSTIICDYCKKGADIPKKCWPCVSMCQFVGRKLSPVS